MKYILLFLLILPIAGLAPASANKKYSIEQLRHLKPPLKAQHFTLKPKACWPPVSDPLVVALQSPKKYTRRLRHIKAPANTPELKAANPLPFPEVVITFEALK